MPGTIFFKFHTGENDKDRNITFSKDSTIEQLLLEFLRQTNSVMTLEESKIVFMNKSRIMNKPDNLQKKISSHFNNSVKMIEIKVIDTANILGGEDS